jgi:predicted transglutaminase-like cysteine proteinase
MGAMAKKNPIYGTTKAIRRLILTSFCFVVIATNSLQATQWQTDFSLFLSVLADRYGERAAQRGAVYQAELEKLDGMSVEDQLKGVNRYFNQAIVWKSDQEIYGTDDFWATPSETIGRGRGDCEDFTIAKYVSLRHLGIPSNELRLTYVKLRRTNGQSQAHMVLAWYPQPGATPLILDNANPYILPASQRRDLRPVFSFTSDALWLASSNKRTNVDPSSRLSQWRQMLNRAQSEGIRL